MQRNQTGAGYTIRQLLSEILAQSLFPGSTATRLSTFRDDYLVRAFGLSLLPFPEAESICAAAVAKPRANLFGDFL
jgi:hypothetical protein